MNYLPEGSEWVPSDEETTQQQYSTRGQKGRTYTARSSREESYYDAEVTQGDDSTYDDEYGYSQIQDPPATIERPASRYSSRNETTTYGYDGRKREQYSCQTCGMAFDRASDRNRHVQTVHVGNGERNFRCDIADCAAGVTTWRRQDGLGKHNKTWHSYSCEVRGCSRAYPRGFESQTALEAHQEAAHSETSRSIDRQSYDVPEDPVDGLSLGLQSTGLASSSRYTLDPLRPPSSTSNNRRAAINPTSSKLVISGTRGQYEKLDRRYKVQPPSFFKPGKVFKILWSEPGTRKGENSDTDVSETEFRTKHGESVYTSIRRFVVIRNFSSHSQCLPIYTYGQRGLLKRGVVPDHHAKIFISESDGSEQDINLLTRDSIRIRPDRDDEMLDPMSRLNYSKVYTIEHNVKVFSVGRVAKECEHILIRDFDEIHQPLSDTTWGQSAIHRQSGEAVGYDSRGKGIDSSTNYAYEEGDDPYDKEGNYPNEFDVGGPSQNSYSTYTPTYETYQASAGPSYEDAQRAYQVGNTEDDSYGNYPRSGTAAASSVARSDREPTPRRRRGVSPEKPTSRRHHRDARRR